MIDLDLDLMLGIYFLGSAHSITIYKYFHAKQYYSTRPVTCLDLCHYHMFVSMNYQLMCEVVNTMQS